MYELIMDNTTEIPENSTEPDVKVPIPTPESKVSEPQKDLKRIVLIQLLIVLVQL